MKAQDKAKDLVEKCRFINYDLADTLNHKEYAILIVNEIMFALKQEDNPQTFEYWQEVIHEIEKL